VAAAVDESDFFSAFLSPAFESPVFESPDPDVLLPPESDEEPELDDDVELDDDRLSVL